MKISKKILSIVLAAIMAFSMMPITAFAATALTKVDNNLGTANFNTILYNGIDYIAINYEGVNADKKIVVKEGTTSATVKSVSNYYKNKYANENTMLNDVKNSGHAYWYYGEGSSYCVTTDAAHSLSGTGVTISASGFGTKTNENGTYRDGKTTDITTTYTIDTSTLKAGTYNLSYSFKYQMKESTGWINKRWSTQKEYSGSETFQLVVEHNYQADSSSAKAATCTEAGKEADLVCSVCQDRQTGKTIDKLGHDYQTDGSTYKAPTCTVAGKQADQFCTRCNDTITGATINALGHDMQVVEGSAKAATCTEAGKEADMACSRCDYKETGAEIPATGHTNGTPVQENVEDSNCTTAGSYDEVVYCTVCNTEISRTQKTIDAKGHTEVTDEAVDATCTTKGLTQGSHCSVCGEILVPQEPVDALGHDMQVVDGTAVAPTCTVAGKEADKACSRCDYKETGATINATGHNYTTNVVAPTCTEQGYTEYTCTKGDHTYKDNYTDALGHTEVIDEAVAATCKTTGLTQGSHCSVCKEVLVAQTVTDIDPNAHVYGTEITDPGDCETPATVSQKCTLCGYVNVISSTPAPGHQYQDVPGTYVAPTCTTAGKEADQICSECDAEKTGATIPATGHTPVTDDAKAPTCTETGLTQGSHCSVCGEILLAQDPVDALGHDMQVVDGTAVAPTCTVAGKEADKACSRCDYTEGGVEIPATGHKFTNYVYNNDATKEADGTETAYCDNGCGTTDTKTAVGTKLPEITIDVVDKNTDANTASKVDVSISKDAENNTVVNAEIKAEEEANGTKFIGWYDEAGNLVSSNPQYVVTDTSKPLTVKTADRANDGYSLGMNGQVDCHVYIDTLYYTDDVDNATITVTYNQNGTTYAPDVVTKTFDTASTVINNGDEFLFTTGYAPVQISEEITVTITAPDMQAPKVIKASIEKYCAAVIKAGTYSEKLTKLCQSVINYGSAAQGYFEGVTSPAITTKVDNAPANLTTADVEKYKPTIQQTSASRADFQVTDMTFMSLDNSAIRFYYTGSLDGYTVTVDGAKVTPQSKVVNGETYNYFEVSGIAAADLDALHDIRITKDSKIAFYAKASALSYVYLGVNNAPGALQNYKTFLATLVDYNIKNKEYKASKA